MINSHTHLRKDQEAARSGINFTSLTFLSVRIQELLDFVVVELDYLLFVNYLSRSDVWG